MKRELLCKPCAIASRDAPAGPAELVFGVALDHARCDRCACALQRDETVCAAATTGQPDRSARPWWKAYIRPIRGAVTRKIFTHAMPDGTFIASIETEGGATLYSEPFATEAEARTSAQLQCVALEEEESGELAAASAGAKHILGLMRPARP